ncbi:DUF7108 family protein [Natrialbaceae archaeon AArc-T1-2]|uniref:DUF7108 family protein n=1 Tax=Natrialbaceae archaeon AArc-T1-2 TaxID=3053904 RepID=UPI00255AD6E9|nr:rnhA operon protein [Natrialbaceae archaeon AArc-T1-2]WIV66052.1 rnhA operon protein [Natrialbaceae archaeon AArc-T1-2]
MTPEDVTDGADGPDSSDATDESELPAETVEEAERLTRLARNAIDENERDAYRRRREDVLEPHGFTARVRTEDAGDVLVLYPAEWREDGVIRTDRIDDLSRAVEIRLDGPGDPDDWDDLDAANRALVDAVRKVHGDVHGDNAAAFADFMSNHYARPMTSATGDEITEFRTEYFVRNAWPSKKQREVIEESIALVFETAGESVPEFRCQ